MQCTVDFVPRAGVCQICSVSSVPVVAASSPHHHDSRARLPCLFKEFVISRKAEHELLGITAAGSDHREQIFPTGCFSFQLPGLWWYLHLGPVVSLFHENPLE